LTNDLMDEPKACILRVKALAGMGDCAAAEEFAARAKRNKPVSVELGFLHAVLLINLNRYTEAKQALRQVLYLDRSLASVHFTLGSVLHHLGEPDEAARSYRNARDLADTCPADETIPLSEGERADRLVAAATAQLELICNSPEGPV
jgi:chemotaxis protein methyltransferase CheR